MQIIFCVIFATSIHLSWSQDQKYCDKSLCTDWSGAVKPHIACPANFQSQCPADAEVTVITDELKNMILDYHNTYRNTLAGGKLPGFPSARKMPAVTWDDELAYFAQVNVKRCTFEHDKCRNSATFKWAGQNLAITYAESDEAHVKSSLEMWWGEYNITTVNDINKYSRTERMIGHFTAMAQDRTAKVGCGAMKYTGAYPDFKERLFACDYSFTNLLDSPVYVSGPTAANCKTGRHSKYPNLCSEKEVVDPNPTF